MVDDDLLTQTTCPLEMLRMKKKATDILDDARAIVGGDRASTHGDKVTNHQNIARLWSAYLWNSGAEIDLSPLDVANMMELLKIARRQAGAHNVDDYVDGAGYAACAGEIAEIMERGAPKTMAEMWDEVTKDSVLRATAPAHPAWADKIKGDDFPDESDDWIEWHGGECPVAPDTWLQAKFRDGDIETKQAGHWDVCWQNDNMPEDIIAYRLVR